MLTCRDLVEVVGDYLEGSLPPDRHAEVVAHLEHCEDCLRYLTQLQSTLRILPTVSSPNLSAEQRSAAVDAFREWCLAAHPPVDVRRPWWRRLRRAAGRR
jgi:anti-sigma factor RsiW